MYQGRDRFLNFSDAPPENNIFVFLGVNANPPVLGYVFGVYLVKVFVLHIWLG
jgi:hypothetical protein